MTGAGAKRVFISHSSADADTAREICAALEAAGCPCWIAPRDVRPGYDYGAEIASAIRACDFFLLLLSPAVNGSDHIVHELELANKKKSPGSVIAVFLEQFELEPGLEYRLAGKHWIERGGKGFEQLMREIVVAVHDDRPPPPPPPRMPESLKDLIEATGLKYVEVEDTIGLGFKPQRAENVVVQAKMAGEDLALFYAELPAPGTFGKDVYYRNLLRMSFLANYAKAILVEDRPLVVVELPRAALTVPVVEGVIRGAAALADVAREDVASLDRLERVVAEANLALGHHIVVNREAAAREACSLAGREGFTVKEHGDGWMFDVEVADQSLNVFLRVFPSLVSYMVPIGASSQVAHHAKGSALLLRANGVTNVAKVGLDSDGDVALMLELPRAVPGVGELLREQFALLLAGVVTAYAGG